MGQCERLAKALYINPYLILISSSTLVIKMLKLKPKLESSPTLNTVLMVERVLKNMGESVITVAELKRRLPRQVNHNTLKIILEYLEISNKIVVTMKGITWIHNTHPYLRKVVSQGLEL